MRTFVGDDEFVQPKRNETAPRSECRPTFKNALTQPRLLEMDVKPAFLQRRTLIDKWTTCRLFGQVDKFRLADDPGAVFFLDHPGDVPTGCFLTGTAIRKLD